MAWIKPFEEQYLIQRKSDGLYMGKHKYTGWVNKQNLALTTTKEALQKMYRFGDLATHYGVHDLSEIKLIKPNGVLV